MHAQSAMLATCIRCSLNQGITKIMAGAHVDREAFSKVIKVPALRVPNKKCQQALSMFSEYILNRPKVRPVQKDSDRDTRLVLLSGTDSLDQGLSRSVVDLAAKEGYGMEEYDLELDYTHYSAEEVLKQVLPEGVQAPNSFELVGHIAHLNLKGEHEEFKKVIGEVIIDKNPSVKTVVNKIGTIENEFRVFQMEVLAGEPNFETEVKEHAFRFKLDYSKVYWNSRLEHEHDRLVSKFRKHDVICDMMAGIGPFAIPAGRKGCVVHANDLNPESFKYLQDNIVHNKVKKNVLPYNLDGREFVRLLVGKEDEILKLNLVGEIVPPVLFDHVIMNLPASAVEFLDVFNGLFGQEWVGRLPWIHCYTFIAGKDTSEAAIVKHCEKYLGGSLGPEVQVHRVRDVAPNKLMVCVSFRLQESIAMERAVGSKSKTVERDEAVSPHSSHDIDPGTPSKRHKV